VDPDYHRVQDTFSLIQGDRIKAHRAPEKDVTYAVEGNQNNPVIC
jgi:hypothetical protein